MIRGAAVVVTEGGESILCGGGQGEVRWIEVAGRQIDHAELLVGVACRISPGTTEQCERR